ncbi:MULTISPECIES: hypothetical protein [Burkholderia]|uniref:hypothetical protein n=1 Tax=Burkholderia TaxID=32008 RepID=UPI00103E45F5|nr:MULTISPECIES: hypothetical protein [Burkholderia]
MIALGDQRVDGGLIENMNSPMQYACLAPYINDARDAQAMHFPSSVEVPALPQDREVQVDSNATTLAATQLLSKAQQRPEIMLQLFGKSLHPLQDSFAHRGVPDFGDVPSTYMRCAARLSMSAPKDRQKGNYHTAEVTYLWPNDVLRMARETYEFLLKYPDLDRTKRVGARWESISSQIVTFSAAKTKAQKAAWFRHRGITDVSFLDGISLKDGSGWTAVRWAGRRLPAFTSDGMNQRSAHPLIVQFYRAFLDDWLTGGATVGKLAKYLKKNATHPRQMADPSLELQLWAWRLRDHGAAIPFLFGESNGEVAKPNIATIMRRPGAIATYTKITDAVLPVLQEGEAPSPILPFLVLEISKASSELPRAVALVRLRDAPYETVAIGAESIDGEWAITNVWSTFDY